MQPMNYSEYMTKTLERFSKQPFSLPVTQGMYKGNANTWLVWNVALDEPEMAINDMPVFDGITFYINLYIPTGKSYSILKKEIRKTLFEAGFEYPTVQVWQEDEQTVRVVFTTKLIFESEV